LVRHFFTFVTVIREKVIHNVVKRHSDWPESDRPLKLIVAGAGYGKSVLMSQWLDTYDGKYCWISLEEDCNDLQIFLSYLIAGIQQQFPENMQRIAQMNSSSQLPSIEAIAQTLNNELLDLPESLMIVWDDFHVIRDNTILNLFNKITKFPPKNVQLALISRLDPPLNKSRLLAYQQICEIRMADLRLSMQEIKELARQSIENEISDEDAKIIEETTEGWALSVYLKIQEFIDSNTVKSDENLGSPHSSNLTPFLLNLIESSLPPDGVKMIMVISLFDRFNLELIEKLFSDIDATIVKSEALDLVIKKIKETDSPLLISLDENKIWFRLHHLIQELLKKRIFQIYSSDQIENFYKSAGVYFASRNYIEEGIQYSILGKNTDHAVKSITSNWETLIDHGENLRLHRLLNMIPVGELNTSAALLVSRAFLCDTFADFDAMKIYLENASQQMDETTAEPGLLGAFASVHACFSTYTNDFPTAMKYADLALETLTPGQSFLWDYALNFKIFSTSMIKSPALARLILEKYRSNLKGKSGRHLMRLNVIKLLFDWNQAIIKDLKQAGKIVVEISRQEKVWWMYKIGNYYLGQYYYMKNQTKEAYAYIDKGIDCFFNAGPVWALQLYYSGAFTALAENDLTKANHYLNSAKHFVKFNNLEAFEGYLRAFEVEFALRTEDIEKSWKLNRSANYSIHPPLYYYYIPQFTQIKLYITKGDPDLMKEAYDLIYHYKEMTGNLLYAKIQVTLLEALWYAKSGLNEKANSTLSEVLTITPEEDYIRVFLDMGQPVRKMMQALPEEQKQMPLARHILMAFRYEDYLPSPKYESVNLTPKEIELMELVSSGMQNKEIADQMCLSGSTVKTYLYRIYQKLEVKNRLSAISKLQELQSSQ
jgi:LuxR family maltose regulon positive regulatory protein